MELRGKKAVITGGAMGIGLATVKRLASEGCDVTIWDINENAIEDAREVLKNLNARIFYHVCDITDKKKVYELASIANEEMGQVDILINNAGYVSGGDFLERDDEVWEKTIEINLTALLYTTKAFLPGMYERNSGAVINISSASGLLGVPGLSVYAATKWAVWGLTESLRFEAWNRGKKGVRFASIHPSYIRTGLFEGAKLKGLGSLIVPLLKDHDVVAKAIVNSALKRGVFSPKRPRTVNLTLLLRGILPDFIFQRVMILMGVTKSMSSWKGRS